MERAFLQTGAKTSLCKFSMITKNNVKENIWKLYMKFEANKEFIGNLSLQGGGGIGFQRRKQHYKHVFSSTAAFEVFFVLKTL